MQALARYSLLQRASVQSALEAISHYTSLRTSAGPAFVDARNLVKVRVDHASIHGVLATAELASLPPEHRSHVYRHRGVGMCPDA